MDDGIHLITCDRPGCGKDCGAVRVKLGQIVESEFTEGHCTEEEVDEEMKVTKVRHFCSIECANKKDEFVDPMEEEVDGNSSD